MKKFTIPGFIILSIISIGFLLYSIVQRIETAKAMEFAEQQKVFAVENAKEANKQKRMAEQEREFFQSRIKNLEDSVRILKRK